MNLKQVFFVVFIICAVSNLHAQKDSVSIKLNGFSLSISKVKDFSKGYFKTVLSDSLKQRNIKSLTEMLRFNSFIYFKETGLGMVSSPSFRGTNASQTAVIWNGININSQLNGQTDFNGISANSYDNISVRSGGGSVLFGSGAIGGTVHLNNEISFEKALKNKILLKYGSFDTKHISYDFVKSSLKSYLNFKLGYNSSNNNFEYLNSKLTNENGSFFNYNFDVNFGYKINNKNQLKFYSNSFFADRNLSRTINAPSNDAYKNTSIKNLLEWDYSLSNKEIITTRISYIFDEFRYFDNNKNRDNFSTGNTKRNIAQVDYNNAISRKLKLNAIVGFESVSAFGTSFASNTRNIFFGVLSLNHQLTKKLSYGIQFRKDIQNNFDAPFLYSLGIEHKFNKNYTLSFNTSKNFRIPTFNDLYWNPGGNINLKPENSYQFEIGNAIRFKNVSFNINGFYIKSSDLIQWNPNNLGVWSPSNISDTRNIGLEFSGNYNASFKNHLVTLNATYSYTDARDLERNEQLISVPKNRATFLLNYNYKNFSAFYQFLANDKVSFLVDIIPAFSVSNLGFNYQLSRFKNKPTVGFKINNIYNTYYQNTLNRPMPGTNFQITTNINF
ncbi:TonB-dependent receptor [Polaribacter haliotis]|uniref:TonB-dependent receptor n=1 Tax=Polaribacter haliotis TaxID=1888915 RepID=A0A7L8AH77_9FLAO|nr:TonB-dependent receptor [Polaribacter haliotis]QOD61284.1 TonB-dependent receptor [Polaribacter haliotis]